MSINEVVTALDYCADGKCAKCKLYSVKRKYGINLCREQLITNMSAELKKILKEEQ